MTRCRLALLLLLLPLGLASARAAPLDKAACDKLKAEQAELEQGGVRATMANGPQWAKANLKPEQLDHIHRILDVEAQLLFRCNGRPLVALPKDVDAEPALSDAGEPVKEPAGDPAAPGPASNGAPTGPPTGPPTGAGETHAGGPQGKGAPPRVRPSGAQHAVVSKGPPAKAPAARAATATAAPRAAAEPTTKTKAKPKGRADDAYKPPPSDPATDPFAARMHQNEQR